MVISSIGDLVNPFLSMRSQPWIVSGKLYVDPAIEKGMDFIKNIHANGLDGGVGQWSNEWFAGMRGELKDNKGNPVETFGYFLPTWGLHFVLKTNAPGTSGDWAMIQWPVPYSWGGTWLVASAKTKNPNAAKELIRYLTTENGFLEAWAKDTGDVVSNAERARTAQGIRFKVYGDGKPWVLAVTTEEIKTDYQRYQYRFDTIKNKVSVIDIPYSALKQPEWAKQVTFNKNTIENFIFQRNHDLGMGASTIKIFDIEVY
ncbi:ABC transporter substrate-binding protein [Treponema sp. R8-4-B8]